MNIAVCASIRPLQVGNDYVVDRKIDLGKNSRLFALDNFDINQTTKKYIDEYK